MRFSEAKNERIYLVLTVSKISLVTTSQFSLEHGMLYTLRTRINISISQASPGLQPLMGYTAAGMADWSIGCVEMIREEQSLLLK